VSASEAPALSGFRREGDGVAWTGNGETLLLQPWGPDSIRARSVPLGPVLDTDWALLPPEDAESTLVLDGRTATLRVGRLVATLTEEHVLDLQLGHDVFACRVSYSDADGRELLSELSSGGSLKLRARDHRPTAHGAGPATMSFDPPAGEHLVGMGVYQQDLIDLKGATLELAHRNSQASVPFVLSSRGYGFLWHDPSVGRAVFATNRTEWHAAATRQIDYWITAGRTPADITRSYARATGASPEMPEYGLGFWQCKLRYWNQEQLLSVAREHRRRGLPMAVIVADFFHWPRMGDFRFEEEFWPDPAAMVAELNELGIELMVSVWPQVSVESENFAEFRQRNLLATALRGPDVQMSFEGPSMFLDVTNPEAADRLWELCKRNYHDLGIRLFWLDEAEPEYAVYDHDNYRFHSGPALETGNIYPQRFSRAFFEGQRAAGQEEVVNLVRCAWAGSQRYGALVWSGDIGTTFADLRRQITAAIHVGAAGIPWFTTDIGGFHGGDPDDPAFRELLIRWFQFATFCPVVRLHGDRRPTEQVAAADGGRRSPSGGANEIWSFGDEATEILTEHLAIRERLRPYVRAVFDEAHTDGQPVLRGLFHGFPEDPRAWTTADEFLFGPDLLVAPVLQAGARNRTVYLPGGARWTDLWTRVSYEGGQTVEVEAPLERIPVFGRDSVYPIVH
jgi:alpha-D-xyloside xylohydrolase